MSPTMLSGSRVDVIRGRAKGLDATLISAPIPVGHTPPSWRTSVQLVWMSSDHSPEVTKDRVE
jgi:hypothetical protein